MAARLEALAASRLVTRLARKCTLRFKFVVPVVAGPHTRGVATAAAEPGVNPDSRYSFPPGEEKPVQSELLDSWSAGPGSEVYANPICSQMDQLLLKCQDTDSVLALLVTHRGVFFVHNLVTAVQVLGALSEEAADHIALNELLRDPRYDLLIRDLLRFVPKLDFLAMANVASSLRQLDHKHFVLFSRMLRPLLKHQAPDASVLIRCVHAYNWAGYQAQHEFYAHFGNALAELAPSLPAGQLVDACALFGDAEQYQVRFFKAAEHALLGRGILEHELPPHQVGVVASAFTAHLRTSHDALLTGVAEALVRDAPRMEVSDITLCFRAFRRMALRFDDAVKAGLEATSGPLRRAWLLRRRADGVRTAHVATLLECAAYFGVHTDLLEPLLEYLDDHVDEVGEQASIHAVFAMCLTGAVASHSKLLLYLFRKIGAGECWEEQKLRIFQLWIAQHLQFPWLDCRLRRRCVESGLRAWVLHRRGYGCPFPIEVRELAVELEAMGIPHRTFVPIPGTPYEIDVVIGHRKDALLVVSEVARNTLDPVGGTLLQMRHLQAQGWRCVVVPRRVWRSLAEAPVSARRQYLDALLASFAL